jgi:large conductance mechanosensitive channel
VRVRELLNDFRKFVTKGNLLEIAIAFILGLYFKDVIDAFTNGIVLAFVAAIFGKPNFQDIVINLGDAKILIGTFLNALINFVLVAFVLFLVVKAYEAMKARMVASGEKSETLSKSEELLEEIRDLLRART